MREKLQDASFCLLMTMPLITSFCTMNPAQRCRHHFTGLAHCGDSNKNLENSFSAFRHAAELGYDVIETDMQVSKDGTIYIFHDDELDRVTTGQGRFIDMPDTATGQLNLKKGDVPPRSSI